MTHDLDIELAHGRVVALEMTARLRSERHASR